MELEKLNWELSLCRLESLKEADLETDVFFAGKTDEEVSLVCRTDSVPSGALMREDGWRAFRFRGVLDFSLIGILAGAAGVLADQGISIFALSTYNTDYVLVQEREFEKAEAALKDAGYTVV